MQDATRLSKSIVTSFTPSLLVRAPRTAAVQENGQVIPGTESETDRNLGASADARSVAVPSAAGWLSIVVEAVVLAGATPTGPDSSCGADW